MKHLVIVIPKGNLNLSSVTGSYEILSRANTYWQKLGNPSRLEIQIASFEKELKLDAGYFSINPIDIREIEKTDLVLVPSLAHDYDAILADNKELIAWISEQYRAGSEVATICTGAFLLAATGHLDGKSCSTHWNA